MSYSAPRCCGQFMIASKLRDAWHCHTGRVDHYRTGIEIEVEAGSRLAEEMMLFVDTPEDRVANYNQLASLRRWWTMRNPAFTLDKDAVVRVFPTIRIKESTPVVTEKPEVVLRKCVFCGCLTDRLQTEWSHGAPKSVIPVCPRSECQKDYKKQKEDK